MVAKKKVAVIKTTDEPIEDLYSGYAIAIDENINKLESNDRILDIVEQIESKGIPLVKYDSIPTNENFIKNIKSVSFFILDWELNPISSDVHDEGQVGLQLGDAAKDSSFEDNIKLIEAIRENSFAPVFIFTAYNSDIVVEWLKKSDTISYDEEDETRNFILVRNKIELTGENSMFSEIEKWINSNPAIYSLKTWENSFYKAKNTLFWDLFSKSPKWPEVLWKSYEDDMVNPKSNFNEIIFKLIVSRTSLERIEKSKILNEKAPIIKEELKEVVKEIMYLDNKYLNNDEVRPGDIFKIKKHYYLNIRPECDTVTGRFEDGNVYLIKGSTLSSGQIKPYFELRYSKEKGLYERHDEIILFGVNENDFIVFKFNKIRIELFSELMEQDKRICRVMHPFINNVLQKYASYSGRVGLPRFPHDLMMEVVPQLVKEEIVKKEVKKNGKG